MPTAKDIFLFALAGGLAGAGLGYALTRPSGSGEQPAPPLGTPVLVLLLGDSNASGLAAYWSSEGTKYGNPTASKPKGGTGAVYWRDKVSPLMSSLRPGVVVMSLGGNDYHTNTRAVKDGIVQIVKAIREAGVEFVWLDGPEFPFEDTAGIRQAWLDAIATYGGYQFDGRGRGLPHRSDKIHLTAEGYQSLASMLWTFMSDKGLLRKP